MAFDAALEANRWLGANVGMDFGRVLFGAVHRQLGGQVRWLISGGAALPRETRERFEGLGLALTEGYGLTEAAPVLTVAPAGKRSSRGVGPPVPGVELKIDRADREGIGEVLARGPNVMAGYTDQVDTEQAIDSAGWLHTGDLGRMDAKGHLEIVGRIKDVVISPTGENLYPDDIEQRLGTVPHVAELAVVGVEAAGGERLACLAVARADEGVEAAERHARARSALRMALDELPAAQRPALVFFDDAPLPRTATRKVKREEVRAAVRRLIAAQSSPPPLDVRVAAAAFGPAADAHGYLAVRAAVAALRGARSSEIRAHDTLRGELGFDSLMMTQLHESLEHRFGPMDSDRLQRCETVAEIEQLLAEQAAAGSGGSTGADLTGAESAGATAPDAAGDPRWSQPATLAEDAGQDKVALPPPVREMGKALIGKVQDFFYGEVMKPRVLGRAYIPHNRNAIVVANHTSHLDMGFVRHALGSWGADIVSLAAQDYFFESGLKRAFFENFTNLRPIDRHASLRQAMRQASEVLELGKNVLVFPEGTRSPDGEIRPFKPLIGYLALAHGTDILPVHLSGTHAAMARGAAVPTRRDIVARIGPPLCPSDLARLTQGMSPTSAAREVARIAQAAVLALRDGQVLDLAHADKGQALTAEREHPMVKLFAELEGKFRAGEVERPVSYYVSLGTGDLAKWTVRVDAQACDVRPGRPDGGQADCVLKTSPEIFTKIVRESYVPSPADFVSGIIKSNDVSLLMTFQKVFQLEQAS
jgi:long-chain acyl-CoA synthetase